MKCVSQSRASEQRLEMQPSVRTILITPRFMKQGDRDLTGITAEPWGHQAALCGRQDHGPGAVLQQRAVGSAHPESGCRAWGTFS